MDFAARRILSHLGNARIQYCGPVPVKCREKPKTVIRNRVYSTGRAPTVVSTLKTADNWFLFKLRKHIRSEPFSAAILGAGKSLLQLDFNTLSSYQLIVCCNNVANLFIKGCINCPKFMIIQIDRVQQPVLSSDALSRCALLVTSENNRDKYQYFCDNIIYFPKQSPIRPLGASGAGAWLSRLLGANKIDVYGCDSARGDFFRGFHSGNLSGGLGVPMYRHHPANLMLLAGRVPVRWMFPNESNCFVPMPLEIAPGSIVCGSCCL